MRAVSGQQLIAARIGHCSARNGTRTSPNAHGAYVWRDRWVPRRRDEPTTKRSTELALRLHHDRHFRREAGKDLDRDLVRSERLERLLEIDLVAIDRDPAPAEGVGDVLRGDRAVELAALADLDAHRQGRRRNPGCGDIGLF